MAAAVAEFGAHGYAGARTASIASRAGVNAQLITYYFGGKRGLLEELRRRWAAKQTGIAGTSADFRSALAAYLQATLSEPDWSRLLIWQALGDAPDWAHSPEVLARQHEHLHDGLSRIRARQQAREVTSEVEPEFVLLLAYAVALAPIALPHIVSALYGDDHAAYRDRWIDQLCKLLQPRETIR